MNQLYFASSYLEVAGNEEIHQRVTDRSRSTDTSADRGFKSQRHL